MRATWIMLKGDPNGDEHWVNLACVECVLFGSQTESARIDFTAAKEGWTIKDPSSISRLRDRLLYLENGVDR